MSITAKFPGTCNACGAPFAAGTEIEWQKGKGSRHVKCPGTVVKSKAPLNSPGRSALQGRGRGDSFLGEKTDIVLGFSSDSKGDQSDFGHTIKAKDGRFLTCVGVASHWVSQDEADDFDLIGPNGSFERHWSLLKYYRLATAEEQAQCEARILAAENKKRFNDLCDWNRGEAWEWVHDQFGRLKPEIKDQITESVCVWKKFVGYSLHECRRTNLGLLAYHPVYDDSPTQKLLRWEKMTPEETEMIRQAPEVK